MPGLFDQYVPYLSHLNTAQYSQAINGAVELLKLVNSANPTFYNTEHKGTPFYWLGLASFLCHDYQRATFFMDAAAAEDIKNHAASTDLPARLFVELNYSNPNQAALPIVLAISAKLTAFVASYNARQGSNAITFQDIQAKFLQLYASAKPHERSLTTAFISFIAELDFNSTIVDLASVGSSEPFFTHLFRGCLLFETLLKLDPQGRVNSPTLGNILKQDLVQELGTTASMVVGNVPFSGVVAAAGKTATVLSAMEITAQARNTLGHNLVWATAPLTGTDYNAVAGDIAAALLHAISCLYC